MLIDQGNQQLSEKERADIQAENTRCQRMAVTLNNKDRSLSLLKGNTPGEPLEKSSVDADSDAD